MPAQTPTQTPTQTSLQTPVLINVYRNVFTKLYKKGVFHLRPNIEALYKVVYKAFKSKPKYRLYVKRLYIKL